MRQIKRYLLAMNATALQSAVHALKLFCGAAGVHQVYDAVPLMDIRLGAVVFLIAFGNAILDYIDTHPLPEIPEMPPAVLPPKPPPLEEHQCNGPHSPNPSLARW